MRLLEETALPLQKGTEERCQSRDRTKTEGTRLKDLHRAVPVILDGLDLYLSPAHCCGVLCCLQRGGFVWNAVFCQTLRRPQLATAMDVGRPRRRSDRERLVDRAKFLLYETRWQRGSAHYSCEGVLFGGRVNNEATTTEGSPGSDVRFARARV